MRRDKEGNIIGSGEDTAISILHDLYDGNTKIVPQYPLTKVLTEEYKLSLSIRNLLSLSIGITVE